MKRVTAAEVQGWNMSIFGWAPKWTIRCGDCGGTFRARIPPLNYPAIGCPYCGTLNTIPVTVE